MKFEDGREQRTSAGGENSKRQVLSSKTSSSEKSKNATSERLGKFSKKKMFSLKC